jgi:NADPH:quinone reductase-like Zn-dependent oxidoreductase
MRRYSEDTMHHVTFSEIGGPEVLKVESFELPPVGPKEVRVSIEAIGVNRFEALYRRNFYVVPATLPSVLGVEGVATVMEVGAQVVGHSIGDRVAILPVQTPFVGSGVYATHANVPASALVKSIPGTTAIEEAAVWMAGLQAYNLITKVPIGAGDAVLVTAGTSPVGSALIQFARDMGATVLATTRTDARKQELLDLGAHHIIATDEQALSETVLDATGGKGVKVVLDTVGGALLAQCVSCLAEGGSLFSYGAQTSPDITAARVDVPLVALDRRYLSFVDLFELTDVPERFAAAQEYIRDAVARAAFKPRVDSTFQLKDVQEAHRRMEDGVLSGKVIITTN